MITGNYFARKVLAQGCIGENENILVVGGDFSSAAVPVPEHQRGRTWHFRASSFRPSDVPSETSQLCYRICSGHEAKKHLEEDVTLAWRLTF